MGTATTVCMSIAGSDSGGGAGIQADLKAFARCGVHGTTVVTAITAQNTLAVTDVFALPPAMIEAQADAIFADIPPDAIKIGMVGSAAAIAAVARVLDRRPGGVPVVLDPVMVSESGARLLDSDAERTLLKELVPRATVVTPNVAEARVLAGAAADLTDAALARAVIDAGAPAVVLTGGHRDVAEDLLLRAAADEPLRFAGPREPDGAAHGSGCTHSSVLAAALALGNDLQVAARIARELAAEAVANGLRTVGGGAGPVSILGRLGAAPIAVATVPSGPQPVRTRIV